MLGVVGLWVKVSPTSSNGISSISVWYSEILQGVRARVCLLVEGEQVKEVYADDRGLFLRRGNDAFEFFIEAL